MYCKETNYNIATHVPIMVRAPQYPGSHGRTSQALVELVDLYPTLAALAGAPPLNRSRTGEPPLGGRSLEPLLRSPSAVASTPFNASFSQYARFRCFDDLFLGPEKATGAACAPGAAGHFMGYTVRAAGWRYTRWTNVTITAPCMGEWDAAYGE